MSFGIYVISIINSEGIPGRCARESILISSIDPDTVSRKAYSSYKEMFSAAKDDNTLDDSVDTMLTAGEFREIMKKGFSGENDLALIQCTGYHVQFEASFIPLMVEEGLLTNREYLAHSLIDPNWVDDGGASYDSWLHYNISCPYFSGDERAHCNGKPDDYINWENCNACKEQWLDMEVDL